MIEEQIIITCTWGPDPEPTVFSGSLSINFNELLNQSH